MGDVDDSLAALPEPQRGCLQRVIAAARRIVPEAEEGRSYGMPALKLDGKPLIMDLQTITRIDTAGLQLLCCFAAEAKRLQIVLNWQPLPASVQQALDLAGIDLTGNAAANTESPWQSF